MGCGRRKFLHDREYESQFPLAVQVLRATRCWFFDRGWFSAYDMLRYGSFVAVLCGEK